MRGGFDSTANMGQTLTIIELKASQKGQFRQRTPFRPFGAESSILRRNVRNFGRSKVVVSRCCKGSKGIRLYMDDLWSPRSLAIKGFLAFHTPQNVALIARKLGYNCYKRRMQIEQGFRDLKSLFGFGALRLTQLTKARLRNLFLFVVISEGVLMLLYQKSGYRWSREFNDGKKQFSLIAVIKTVVADCFATFRLCPFFELPLPEVHILIE